MNKVEKKLQKLEEQKKALEEKLMHPKEIPDHKKDEFYSELSYLQSITSLLQKTVKLQKEVEETETLLNEDLQNELKEMAETELIELKEKLEKAKIETQELEIDYKYKDPDDARSAIIEIRAGVGGDEASLFAGDLFRMYKLYADSKEWSVTVIGSSINESGGFKEITASIDGKNVYQQLKYESGVHRVQRVPVTESKGRIHTSTASVAILPEAKEIDIQINPEDINVEVMRASGAGGQCVNKTDSAVRITHLSSGIIISCQETKYQAQNKEKAMAMLRARLYEKKKQEEHEKRDNMRLDQIGSMMRAEKIRTYNFPQSRITDHRIKESWHNMDQVLNGDIEPIIKAVQKEIKKRIIEDEGKRK